MGLFSKIFGTRNERELKKLQPRVDAINALEPKIASMSDEQLTERIRQLKEKMTAKAVTLQKDIKDPKRSDYIALLDPVLEEVFAIVREAGKRVLNMRHYDVQLIGGMVLHMGKIAEMKTGEGKTLVATLPAVLNALVSKGVHIVTVNDYLATRDAEWMGRIYRFLGLHVGVVIPNMEDQEKKLAYESDITYGQNNEFGFDYLRDNMKLNLSEYMQREHFFAIVDEVDSILIDEARTPLIISGPAEENDHLYKVANNIVPSLRKDIDFTVDEKDKAVILTEPGVSKCEKLLNVDNLYDPDNIALLHHTNQALRAHHLHKRDVDYVIERGEVLIVDEHTGRLMQGRRWSDGLHQAIEAKENVKIQAENQTLASITFQNFFRMYNKLSGMTGTADTEAEEFAKIYDLDVMLIPTNKPIARQDDNDQVYKTEHEKVIAVVKDIEKSHQKGQPILVGTVSVEKSEVYSRKLKKLGIKHNVLNAKRHKDEATIVAQAGGLGCVTIATNMAGRGTDIVLGGNAEFMARAKVAKKMGDAGEQVAQFAFLTGNPELIDVQKLAMRDREDMELLFNLEQEINRQKENSKNFDKENTPKTLAEAQEHIYNKRKGFYQQALDLYKKELAGCEAECAAEKNKVLAAGGLKIIGTERHESRRIDNQLRGRAGRQGDPGSSCFYLSLQDDLMRIFGSDKMISVMNRLGMEEGVPIEHPLVSKSIATAQKRVEGANFDSRKNVLEYDDVMNLQRKSIYGLRRQVIAKKEIAKLIFDLVEEAIVNLISIYAPEKVATKDWKLNKIQEEIKSIFDVDVDINSFSKDWDGLADGLYKAVEDCYFAKEKNITKELFNEISVFIYLQVIDHRWKEHLQAMDHLREGIHFRGYAQKDPKQEYKREGHQIFTVMMAKISTEVLEAVFKLKLDKAAQERALANMEAQRDKEAEMLSKNQIAAHPQVSQDVPPARNTNTRQPFADEASGQKLNRQQRRQLKSMKRKNRES